MRRPFQGVKNIVRFNWHYYLLSFSFVLLILLLQNFLPDKLRSATSIGAFLICYTIIVSLTVSCYVYDFSSLYRLSWLSTLKFAPNGKVLNVTAGFDETSELLKSAYRNGELFVIDFYNPDKHTEVSIKRARKRYPAFPGTQQVTTQQLPFDNNSIDKIFCVLSVHEIRDDNERIIFFKELRRVLSPEGKLVVVEHLRDTSNFLAYTVGFFHFHSRKTWHSTFGHSQLGLAREVDITPFITTFVLEKNGTAS